MNNVVFAFDLHNTILKSNEAWISAYLKTCANVSRDGIELEIYKKRNRKELAEELGVDYETVYEMYCTLVSPDEQIIELLAELKQHHPVYLISSASKQRVDRDLASWGGANYFDKILTKETFVKGRKEDWDHLISQDGIDLMVYFGNDVEEDVAENERVLSFIHGSFLSRLNHLDLLIKREHVK